MNMVQTNNNKGVFNTPQRQILPILLIMGTLVQTAFAQQIAMPDSAMQVAVPDSIPQVVAPDSIPQVVAQESAQQAEAQDATQQVVAQDSTLQVVAPDSTLQVVAQDTTIQIVVPDSTQQVIAPDTTQQVAVPQEPQKESLPKNAITVDFGPTIIGVLIGKAGTLLSDGEDIKTTGFGIAAKYEFQPFRFISAAARFAMLSGGVGYNDEYELDPDEIDEFDKSKLPPGTKVDTDGSKVKTNAKVNLSSMSFEFHPRLYPFGGSFFLDGMIGYASMSTELSGSILVDIKATVSNPLLGLTETKNITEAVKTKFTVSRDYMKFGGSLGWRADFGKPGGFIFEHSYGWYVANGMGKTMGKQVLTKVEKELKKQQPSYAVEAVKIPSELNDLFSALEDFIFVGGPRAEFAFGWRF